MNPDYRDILAAFAAHRVEYLVVGGYAVAFHGQPRFTKDLDLWIGTDAVNLERVRRALIEFGAPDTLLGHLDSASNDDVLWMGLPPVRIDLMKGVPGGDFARAYASRETAHWDGVEVTVVGRAELIALKRASGRPQDLVDIEMLETGERSS